MNSPLKKLLASCKKGDRVAQRRLYDISKGKLFVLCLRYANSREEAEDILQEGFLQIFKSLNQYKGEGSLEGWMRKVVLRVALAQLKKNRKLLYVLPLHDSLYEPVQEEETELNEKMDAKTIIKMMQNLPEGYRTIMNLYILEGFSHVEISKILNISVGTSKSQLNRAKAKLRTMLEKKLST